MQRRPLAPFEWACLGVIAAAFVVRGVYLLYPNFIWDSAWYLMLSRSFAESGTFLMRWSAPENPIYSGYWPPLFPVYLVPFVTLVGPTYQAIVAGAIVASALLVGATFLTTWDLFDRPRAFAAAAMMAATPAFYTSDARGLSESLLGLMVLLALWAFLRSLEKPAFLPLAGGFAFLAYLGKASLGLPVVGILVGALVVWRVRARGWRRVVRSPWDMGLAAAALVALVALALTRTERIGGIGVGVIEPVQRATSGAACSRILDALPFTGIGCWLAVFVAKVAFVSAFLVVVTLPLSLRLRDAIRAPRTERTDALWLATLLPLLAGAVFTTSFFFTEYRNFVDFDNIRYLTPAFLPFLWLLLERWDFSEPPTPDARDRQIVRTHLGWYAAALGAMVIVLSLNPMTGTETLPRFATLMGLMVIPIAISLGAYATRYHVEERRVGRNVERRYARGAGPSHDPRLMVGLAALLALTAWFFSSWYATVGMGLVVALAASTPRARVVGMAIVLLASAASTAPTPPPVDHVAQALRGLPEGTLVGLTEPVVYVAAAAPDNVAVRSVDGRAPPPGVDVLVLWPGEATPANFTQAASFVYDIDLPPQVTARLWIERNVMGNQVLVPEVPGFRILVRDGSGLESYVSRA